VVIEDLNDNCIIALTIISYLIAKR
jgi:hypothetical protein